MIIEENIVRQKFLMGMSLSEISFIYFMLLLIISLYSIYDFKSKISKLEASLKSSMNEQEDTTLIEERTKYIKDEIGKLLGLSQADIDKEFTRLVDVSKIKLKKTIKHKNKEVLELKQKLDEINNTKEEFKLKDLKFEEIFEQFSEIRRELKLDSLNNDQVKKEIRGLKDQKKQLASTKNNLNKANREIERFKIREEYIKSKGKGLELPPCFIKKSSQTNKLQPDFMYEIEIHPTKYKIKSIWKEKHLERMKQIPGAIFSGILTLKKNDFPTLGEKILDDAKKHKCNHWAISVDKTGESKKIWKANLKFVKGYIYTHPH